MTSTEKLTNVVSISPNHTTTHQLKALYNATRVFHPPISGEGVVSVNDYSEEYDKSPLNFSINDGNISITRPDDNGETVPFQVRDMLYGQDLALDRATPEITITPNAEGGFDVSTQSDINDPAAIKGFVDLLAQGALAKQGKERKEKAQAN